MKESEIISNVISKIKKQIGFELTPCDCFSGLQLYNNRVFLNVVTNTPVFNSSCYNALIKASGDGKFIELVEPNGHRRLAIFFDINQIKC